MLYIIIKIDLKKIKIDNNNNNNNDNNISYLYCAFSIKNDQMRITDVTKTYYNYNGMKKTKTALFTSRKVISWKTRKM